MTSKLDHELHVHLYGCLTAEDLWQLGKDAPKDPERLKYFVSEYEKAFQVTPEPLKFWSDGNNGLDLLRQHFEFIEPGPFAQFQAKFNLIIALFPIQPNNPSVLRAIMARHRAQGIKHVEYRCFIPPHFNDHELAMYFQTFCEATREFVSESSGAFDAQMAFSFPRNPELCWKFYTVLRKWLREHPKYYSAIAGIDFCHFEEGYPPALLRDFCLQVVRDNAERPHEALAILYHVGESFEGFSVMSSARWVWQAHAMGADRLGHAISLGVDPSIYLNKTVHEPISERRDHLYWLLAQEHWLKNFGHQVDGAAIKKELQALSSSDKHFVRLTYNPSVVEDCRSLQDAMMQDLALKDAVIESCPTSNFRIGRIPSVEAHPLSRFVDSELDVCISTDDPGIFAIDLEHEESLCRGQFKLPESAIAQFAANASNYKSHSKRVKS